MTEKYTDPQDPTDLPNVSQGSLDVALAYVEEEHDKLLALAITLRQRLEPADPQDPTDSDDLTAWRLAQLIEERLERTEFSLTLRAFVLGIGAPKRA